MDKIFTFLRQWIEVWPLLIPLSVVLLNRRMKKKKVPFFLFIILSLVLSFLANITWLYGKKIPGWLIYNGIFYNLSSVLRVLFWGWYLYHLKQVKRQKYVPYIIVLYILFIPFNFLILEPVIYLSVQLYAVESIVLLVLSLTYYLSTILGDEEVSFTDHSFLICTGISIFEAINFFIYLFIFKLYDENPDLAVLSYRISQYSFIIFCMILAIGLYRTGKKNQLAHESL